MIKPSPPSQIKSDFLWSLLDKKHQVCMYDEIGPKWLLEQEINPLYAKSILTFFFILTEI